MDQKDRDKHAVSDHGWGESFKKEKMKRSLVGSCKAEAESMAEEVKNPTPTMRECNICGKTFSSGKALGGHRRSHFQKNQKKVKVRFANHSSKAGDSSNRANCDYDDDDGKHVCCICKKEFPTRNALFGHMRSHPERSWRGVSPPTTHSHKNSSSNSLSSYSSSSLNSDSMEKNTEDHDDDDDCVGGGGNGNRVIAPDDDVIDLSKLTSPSWLKTDTRGRKCIGGYEAAETLAYLRSYSKYFCGESNRVSPKKDQVLPKSAPPLIKQHQQHKRKIGESSTSTKHEVKKIKFYLKGELKIGKKNDGGCDDEGDKVNRCKGLSESGVGRISYDDEEEDVDVEEGFADVNAEVVTPARLQNHVDEKKVKKEDQKGKNSKKLVLKSKANENGNQEKVGGYKCGACGKIFTTFQGLGGHRSVHKEKNIVTMDESKSNHSDAAVAEENNSSSSSNMHKIDEATTNEAATLPADEATMKNEAPLPADEACQSSGTKKLDFDLNELPCGMED